MQTLVILFLSIFALGMGACVISLTRRNRKLEEDLFFKDQDTKFYAAKVFDLERQLDEEEAERRRFAKANFRLHGELHDTHKMLELVLSTDLENNLAPINVFTEVSRDGVKYVFHTEGGTREIFSRPDEESALASRHSSEQATEER